MRFGGKWLKGWKVIQRTNDYYHVGCDNRTFEGTVNTVVPPPILPISGLMKKRRYSEIGGIWVDDCSTK